jgi:hypothetical protein
MKDAIGICGLLNIQNCIGALKMLLYGMFVHVIDEYFKIDQNITILEAMKHSSSCYNGRACFESHYLRQPTKVNFVKQKKMNENQGFPRMFACLDYMR